MKQEAQTGKRIVSKGAYAKVQAQKAKLNLQGTAGTTLGLLLGFASAIPAVFLLGGIINIFTSPGHTDDNIVQSFASAFGLFLFAGGGRGCFLSGKEALAQAEAIDAGVPLTRANAANLPAPDTLVRASAEPVQTQEAVLLRASVGTQERPEEAGQLLRASAGGSE